MSKAALTKQPRWKRIFILHFINFKCWHKFMPARRQKVIRKSNNKLFRDFCFYFVAYFESFLAATAQKHIISPLGWMRGCWLVKTQGRHAHPVIALCCEVEEGSGAVAVYQLAKSWRKIVHRHYSIFDTPCNTPWILCFVLPFFPYLSVF